MVTRSVVSIAQPSPRYQPRRTKHQGRLLAALLLFGVLAAPPSTLAKDCVVLLHGLARSSGSMETLDEALTARGYLTANIDYPSRHKTIDALAPIAINAGLDICRNTTQPDDLGRILTAPPLANTLLGRPRASKLIRSK